MPDPTTPPPLDDRETVRDEIAGFPIGSGYYATAVGVDEAGELADAVLAVLDLPARDRKNREQGWDEGYGDCWTYHQSHGLAGTETNPYTQENTTMEHCNFCETDVDSVSTGGSVGICADCQGEAEEAPDAR